MSVSPAHVAGATAAIAAIILMMAGVFLDLESERDEVRVEAEKRKAEICADPDCAVNKLMGDLQGIGLSDNCLEAIHKDLKANPLETIQKFEDTVAGEEETPGQNVSAFVHACWMGVADFIAAMTPVVPFMFLPLPQAKVVFIFSTAILLILLGIGRAKLGQRPMLRTVLETFVIAATAASRRRHCRDDDHQLNRENVCGRSARVFFSCVQPAPGKKWHVPPGSPGRSAGPGAAVAGTAK